LDLLACGLLMRCSPWSFDTACLGGDSSFGEKGTFTLRNFCSFILAAREKILTHAQIEALRESHQHTESHVNELRAKYGQAFDEFERVVRQMDELSAELHNISDHAVQLDANFSKYGYSAHLSECDSISQSRGNLPADSHENYP
jgi:hypothetical protein